MTISKKMILLVLAALRGMEVIGKGLIRQMYNHCLTTDDTSRYLIEADIRKAAQLQH
jgi:hypothetical protein